MWPGTIYQNQADAKLRILQDKKDSSNYTYLTQKLGLTHTCDLAKLVFRKIFDLDGKKTGMVDYKKDGETRHKLDRQEIRSYLWEHGLLQAVLKSIAAQKKQL